MKTCKVCGKESDKEICLDCKEDGFIICPVCKEPHTQTWKGCGDKKICEDCHMDKLGF